MISPVINILFIAKLSIIKAEINNGNTKNIAIAAVFLRLIVNIAPKILILINKGTASTDTNQIFIINAGSIV